MNKIFAPIGRWKFFLYIFLFWALTNLYTHFIMFFDLYGTSAFFVTCFELILTFLLVFKRALDIFDKIWKATTFSLISVTLLVLIFILSLATFYNSDDINIIAKIFLILNQLFSFALILFLSFKNGKNSKFFSFEWKKVMKRIALLLPIFFIVKFLTISFNTIVPSVDFRMYPTFETGDRLMVSNITEKTPLDREDIVCIKNIQYLPNPLRIIGLPNEEIKLDGNKIFVNGKLYSDKYAFFSKNLEPINFQETIQLDKDSYFLMGDNRYYDKRGKIKKIKNDNESWEPISIYQDSELNNYIYLTLKRRDLFGKVIAVHYENYKDYKKYHNKDFVRKDISYKFAQKNKKFGFNPSSIYEKLFGIP